MNELIARKKLMMAMPVSLIPFEAFRRRLACGIDSFQQHADVEEEFTRAVKAYTKEVEAHGRAMTKAGTVKRAPRTADDFVPLLHGLLSRLVEAKEQEVDVLRYRNRLPARLERAGRNRSVPVWNTELSVPEESSQSSLSDMDEDAINALNE